MSCAIAMTNSANHRRGSGTFVATGSLMADGLFLDDQAT